MSGLETRPATPFSSESSFKSTGPVARPRPIGNSSDVSISIDEEMMFELVVIK